MIGDPACSNAQNANPSAMDSDHITSCAISLAGLRD
jgi:hypothetical protein